MSGGGSSNACAAREGTVPERLADVQHRSRSGADTIGARSVTGNDECYAEATGHARDDALRQSASISRTTAPGPDATPGPGVAPSGEHSAVSEDCEDTGGTPPSTAADNYKAVLQLAMKGD